MNDLEKTEPSTTSPCRLNPVLQTFTLAVCAYLLWNYLTRKTYLTQNIAELLIGLKDIAILIYFIGCSYVVGSRLFRRITKVSDISTGMLVFSLALGFAFYSVLGLLIAMLHVLSPIMLWATLLIPSVVFWREWSKLISFLKAKGTASYSVHPASVFFIILFFVYGIAAISPPWAIDELTYHLAIPQEYLRSGGIPATSGIAFNYQPMAMSILYMYLMGIGSDYLPKLLHLFFLGLMILSMHRYAISLTTRRIALFATLLFSCQWAVQHGVQRANIDFHMAFYALVSFFLLIDLFLPERPFCISMSTESRIILSGIFLGTAIFSKYTAIASVAGSELLLLYLIYKSRIRMHHFVLFNVFALAIFVPCMIRNYLYTGDPLFWFLSKALGSYRIFNAEQFAALPGIVNLGIPNHSIQLFLLGPFMMYFLGAYPTINFDGFIDPFYMVTIVLGFYFLRTSLLMRIIYIYVVAFYAVWILTAPITRYLLPIMPLLALITMITFSAIEDSFPSRFKSWARSSVTALVLLFCLINLTSFWVSSGYLMGNNIQASLGMIEKKDYLRPTEAGATLEAEKFIDRLEAKEGRPANSESGKIFMIRANQTYYLKRGVYGDAMHLNLPLLKSVEDGGQDPLFWLRSKGYRYILYDLGRTGWYLQPTSNSPYLNPHPENIRVLTMWNRYFSEHIERRIKKIGIFGGLILFQVPEA